MKGVPLNLLIPWPEDLLGALPFEEALSRVLVADLDLRRQQDTHIFFARLLSAQELVLPFPGIDDFALVFQELGPIEVSVKDVDFSIRVELGQVILRLPDSLFQKVQVQEGEPLSDDNGNWVIEEGAVDIEIAWGKTVEGVRENLLSFEVDSSGAIALHSALTDGPAALPTIHLDPVLIKGTGVVITTEDLEIILGGDQAGVRAERVAIYLPNEVFGGFVPPDFNFEDIAINRQGFTGSIAVDWPLAYHAAEGRYYYDVAGNPTAELFVLNGGIQHFGLTLADNTVQGSDIAGSVLLFDEPLDALISIHSNGFALGVGNTDGLAINIQDIIELMLYQLTVGQTPDGWFVQITSNIKQSIELPLISDIIPQEIQLSGFRIEQGGHFSYNQIKLIWGESFSAEIDESGEINLQIPIGKSFLEVLYLDYIFLKVQPNARPVHLEALFTGSISLGGGGDEGQKGFVATVDQMGFGLDLSMNGQGNIGPMQADISFILPKGVGIVVDAAVVKGGGFLFIDREKGEYAGIAELAIQEVIAVKAVCIINTKLPDGREILSLFLLVTAEFIPIQLGYGFTLNGVGGLIAINRSMNLDALRDGVRTNAIDSILFPSDPVANAPQIIADANAFFALAEGYYSFGLMGMIGWGTPVSIITLEAGIMIQVPEPIRIAILGILKVELPPEVGGLLKLQVNFLGAIDFEKKTITFDASLFESYILTFTLTGDMALRLTWGDQPNFLFTAGGFHPDYEPPPLQLGNIKRMAIGFLSGNPRLTLFSYFAITANTVQFGAGIDFYYKVSKFKVVGDLGFDALFQFNPFYMKVSVHARLSVKAGSESLLTVRLSGSIEGPTPWKAQGTGKFKIIFEFSVNFNKVWGSPDRTTLPQISALDLLKDALGQSDNWQATPPPERELLVNTRRQETPHPLAHPYGKLSVSQSKIPLKMAIQKVGRQAVEGANYFSIRIMDNQGVSLSGTDLFDKFPPAQYLEMSDNQKVSRASFESMRSGLEVSPNDHFLSDDLVVLPLEYDELYLEEFDRIRQSKPSRPESKTRFNGWLKNNAIAKSQIGRKAKLDRLVEDKTVKVNDPAYQIVSTTDLKAHEEVLIRSQNEAHLRLASILSDQPELAGELQVIPVFESV